MENQYYHYKPENEIVIDSVVTVHYFKYAKNFFVPGESHDFYELVFVDSGEVEIVNGTDHYTLRQGDAFIHKPDVFHNIKANNVFSNIMIVTFTTASIAGYAVFDKVLCLSNKEKQLISDIVEAADETFSDPMDIIDLKKMTRREPPPFASLQLLFSALSQLLIYICRENISAVPAKNSSAYRAYTVSRVAEYLKNRLDTRVTLTEIAAALNYSVPYLKRLFRAEKNSGIIQYHMHLKIGQARQMIAENRLSLTEIAQSLAFSSLQHFSAAFRKHTNMSPSAFAKSVKLNRLIK